MATVAGLHPVCFLPKIEASSRIDNIKPELLSKPSCLVLPTYLTSQKKKNDDIVEIIAYNAFLKPFLIKRDMTLINNHSKVFTLQIHRIDDFQP